MASSRGSHVAEAEKRRTSLVEEANSAKKLRIAFSQNRGTQTYTSNASACPGGGTFRAIFLGRLDSLHPGLERSAKVGFVDRVISEMQYLGECVENEDKCEVEVSVSPPTEPAASTSTSNATCEELVATATSASTLNTNPEIHLANPSFKTKCTICPKSFKTGIERHYRKAHSEHEVLVSRISQRAAAKVRIAPSVPFVHENFRIFTRCYFCDQRRTLNMSYWPRHILMHTAEYNFVCDRCGDMDLSPFCLKKACEKVKTTQLFSYEYEQGNLYAFLCKKCNYVQTREENMMQHITTQHLIQSNVADEYERVSLVSFVKPIQKKEGKREENAPDEAENEAENEPECGIERVLPFLKCEPNARIDPLIAQMPNSKKEFYLSLNNMYSEPLPHVDLFDARPWIGVGETLTSRYKRRTISLMALFKCMSDNCIFTSNDADKMKAHMKEHGILVKLQESENLIPYDPCDAFAEKRSFYFGWRDCAYCLFSSRILSTLTDHIREVHGKSPFQCSQCFFRAADISYFEEHFGKYHHSAKREILICDVEIEDIGEQKKELLENRSQFLKPFRCDEGNSIFNRSPRRR